MPEYRDETYDPDFNVTVEIRVQWSDLGRDDHLREDQRIDHAITDLYKLQGNMQRKLQILRDVR